MKFSTDSSRYVIRDFMSFNPVLKNPMNHLFQKVKQSILNFPKHESINDVEQECLQFGICSGPSRSPRAKELFFTSNYHY